MPEVAYHPQVECRAVPSTLHDTQVVTVKDAAGTFQYLRLATGFLTVVGCKKSKVIAATQVPTTRPWRNRLSPPAWPS